jgi:hypothetical protein
MLDIRGLLEIEFLISNRVCRNRGPNFMCNRGQFLSAANDLLLCVIQVRREQDPDREGGSPRQRLPDNSARA